MAKFKIFLDNDNLLQMIGLRDVSDINPISNASVEVTLLAGSENGSPVAPTTWPLPMPYVPVGTDTAGGAVLTTPTVVKGFSGMDLTVTVGAGSDLSLSRGQVVSVLHDPNAYRVALPVTGIAESDVKIHLEPYVWTGRRPPTKVKTTIGEIFGVVDGKYAATLQDDLELTKDAEYWAQVDVDVPAPKDLQARFWLELDAKLRQV